ncbi:CDP-alcohol phosphatidyltransferase family protein [Alphaproteobacteria bacterium]|nr:CDP-alcohol phosphatidyltransferase family protein [Alphaproteobacteria bacterium]
MSSLNYSDYQLKAYPSSLRESDLKRGFLWSINRKIAIPQSYLFYRVGLNANHISILRLIMVLVALVFISFGDVLFSIASIILIYHQINLDFADGAVARANNTASDFGTIVDGLPNYFFRYGLILVSLDHSLIYIFIAMASFLLLVGDIDLKHGQLIRVLSDNILLYALVYLPAYIMLNFYGWGQYFALLAFMVITARALQTLIYIISLGKECGNK